VVSVVDLHGLDVAQRANALIGIAAPQFRDHLAAQAHRLGLVRAG
jgi:acyl-CoA hydrolase